MHHDGTIQSSLKALKPPEPPAHPQVCPQPAAHRQEGHGPPQEKTSDSEGECTMPAVQGHGEEVCPDRPVSSRSKAAPALSSPWGRKARRPGDGRPASSAGQLSHCRRRYSTAWTP